MALAMPTRVPHHQIKILLENMMSKKRLSLSVSPIGTKSRMGKIMDHLREDGFEFAMNSEFKPIIVDPEQGIQSLYLVDSQSFEDLLTCSWYEKFSTIIDQREFKFLLSVFREECRRGGKYLTEIEAEELEKNPILQAILEFMTQEKEFSNTTARLLFELRSIEKKLKSNFDTEIPAFTAIFSRSLRRLVPVLKEYGVDVLFKHTDKGSWTTLRRNERFQVEAAYPPTTLGPVPKTENLNVIAPSIDTPTSRQVSEQVDECDRETSRSDSELVEMPFSNTDDEVDKSSSVVTPDTDETSAIDEGSDDDLSESDASVAEDV